MEDKESHSDQVSQEAAPSAKPRRVRRVKGWHKLLLLAASASFSLVLAEVSIRIYFAIEIGPRVLLYGSDFYRNNFVEVFEKRRDLHETPEFKAAKAEHDSREARRDSAGGHLNKQPGYTKFFPHEKKSTRNIDTGARIPVAINSRGFRGPEYELKKPKGVIRVLTLGASSTFGFYNGDQETYPHYLQTYLNESARDERRFEVINFAIPHATSANIAAMLQAEGLALDPDVVTYYQGRNDSSNVHKRPSGGFERIYSVAIHRLLLVALLDQVLVGERTSITASSLDFEPDRKKRYERFLGNLNIIADVCAERGVLFVVANQQTTSYSTFPRKEIDRLPLKGTSYYDETRSIKERMAKGDTVPSLEYSMVIHESLMDGLTDLAQERGIPFVDIIKELDQQRHLLVSWVHLHPEANQVVARSLAKKIRELVYE